MLFYIEITFWWLRSVDSIHDATFPAQRTVCWHGGCAIMSAAVIVQCCQNEYPTVVVGTELANNQSI